jgi:hypothetical protein
MLENKEIKIKFYQTKIENIYKQYNKFQEYKEALKNNISFLQENLIDKEQKIIELENISRAKESEIILLNQIMEERESESVFKRIFNNKNISKTDR